MAKNLTITLPVRTHLKKFAVKEFSRVLSLKNPLGMTVYYMLLKSKRESPNASLENIYQDTLEIEIPEHLIYKRIVTTHLDIEAVTHFNSLLLYFFNRKLLGFVNNEKNRGVEYGTSISKFCEEYEILETDISFETLRKAVYRHRKENMNSLKN